MSQAFRWNDAETAAGTGGEEPGGVHSPDELDLVDLSAHPALGLTADDEPTARRPHRPSGFQIRTRRHERLRPGTRMGRYELLFLLDTGGMAEVWVARILGENGFQRPVAIKVMLPHLAGDRRFVRMFVDEARIAASVASAHVVQTLELGREGGTLFLVLELVVGSSLQDILFASRSAGTVPPLACTLGALVQVAKGLCDVHHALSPVGEPLEIIHRDISPHNILIGLDGRVKLSDFGVARALERLGRSMTGEMKGKVHYCAPEQLTHTKLDQRADVFSLGVVAWNACAGRPLFEGRDLFRVAEQVVQKPIPRLDEVARVPPAVADVVANALVRDRVKRTASAEAFGRDLARAADATVGLAGEPALRELVLTYCSAEVRRLQYDLRATMGARPSERPPPAADLPDEDPLADIALPTVVTHALLTRARWGATVFFVISVLIAVSVLIALVRAEPRSHLPAVAPRSVPGMLHRVPPKRAQPNRAKPKRAEPERAEPERATADTPENKAAEAVGPHGER